MRGAGDPGRGGAGQRLACTARAPRPWCSATARAATAARRLLLSTWPRPWPRSGRRALLYNFPYTDARRRFPTGRTSWRRTTRGGRGVRADRAGRAQAGARRQVDGRPHRVAGRRPRATPADGARVPRLPAAPARASPSSCATGTCRRARPHALRAGHAGRLRALGPAGRGAGVAGRPRARSASGRRRRPLVQGAARRPDDAQADVESGDARGSSAWLGRARGPLTSRVLSSPPSVEENRDGSGTWWPAVRAGELVALPHRRRVRPAPRRHRARDARSRATSSSSRARPPRA